MPQKVNLRNAVAVTRAIKQIQKLEDLAEKYRLQAQQLIKLSEQMEMRADLMRIKVKG